MLPGPGDEAVDDFLRAHLKPLEGVTLEKLREGPVLVSGHEEIVFADGVFATPSGSIELRSEEAARRWGAARAAGEEPLHPRFLFDDPDRRLPSDLLDRLHAQRNDRRVDLAE